MKRYLVHIITKTETPYIIEAETPQDAIERVLAGFGDAGDAGDADYPEPDIFVKPLEGSGWPGIEFVPKDAAQPADMPAFPMR